MHLNDIIVNDQYLITSYDRSIAEIQVHLEAIDAALRADDVTTARRRYETMRESLRPDIVQLQKFVTAMDNANQHLWSVTA